MLAAFMVAVCLAAPAPAQVAAPSIERLQPLAPREVAAFHVRLADRGLRVAAENAARRLEKWLGLLAEVQDRPELGGLEVAEDVAAGLAKGRYKSLVLGESHSVREERAFARDTLALLLSRGLVPAAFLREQFTWDDTGFLAARGVPILEFKNQFQPEPEVDAALRRYRNPLVTYTGHAHSSERVKDYVLYVLESGRPFGYGPGLKDMPTIERALSARGLKPAVVAMMSEETIFDRIQYLFLKEATSRAPTVESLAGGLDEAARAWLARLSAMPAHAPGIRFVRHPKQDNLTLGITRGERRPMALLAALEVLRLPDAAAWAADSPIKVLESLRFSTGAPEGTVSMGYRVILHKAGGETFTREVPVQK